MSLLDDARRLAEIPPEWDGETSRWICSGCSAALGPFDRERDADMAHDQFVHQDYCPWLSMSRIVAALEAAERFVEIAAPKEPRWKALTDYDLRLAALVAALRGEGVTA